MANNKQDCCSFCKRPGYTAETGPLIKADNGVMICQRCVETCHQLFANQENEKQTEDRNGLKDRIVDKRMMELIGTDEDLRF